MAWPPLASTTRIAASAGTHGLSRIVNPWAGAMPWVADRFVPVLIRAACPHIAHSYSHLQSSPVISGGELSLLQEVFGFSC